MEGMLPGAGPGAFGGRGDPSPEQLLAMLEELQRQGHSLDEISPDLGELMRNVKKEKGQKTESDQPTEEIEPEPAFVIKTVDKKSGTKVFLNVCGSDKVPAPGDWSNGQMPADVQKALEDRDGDGSAEALRFPLSAGQAKKEEDKKGEPCVAIDCILNADVLKQAAQFRPLKQFLIELAIGWVSHKAGMDLDVKYKLPKMRYKGDVIEKQNIRVDRKPLVCEIKDLPDEPDFPLLTKKPKQPLNLAKAATSSAAPAPDQPSTSRDAGPAGPSSAEAVASQFNFAGKQILKPVVEFLERPVGQIRITVQLPPQLASSASLEAGVLEGGPVAVDVAGRSVYISVQGCHDLTVPLPFAVEAAASSSEGGEAAKYDLASGQLVLQLRYAPLGSYLQQARDEKPLPFGGLGLASEGLLDLE